MSETATPKQSYMHGAAILTVGVIIMKVLGAIYKIPLGNILGDEGYSLFIGAYSIYNIFFTLATAGLPVALSRLVAEAAAHGRQSQEEKIFRVASGVFFVVGIIFASVLFFFPEWLAGTYLENPDAALSVKAMAPAILLVCLVSAYRGFCQGNGNMIPTTVDEVLEVLFKVVAGLALSTLFIKTGKGLPMGSAGAILGVSVGSVISLGYMVWYKRKNYAGLAAAYKAGARSGDTAFDVDPTGRIIKDILFIGTPIALGACIMAILNSVDSKLCMNRLQSAAGFSYMQAKVLYGIYGKAQTLFNLPAAFITPLTISIVPAIATAITKNERDEAVKISEDSMRVSAALSMPMGVGLAVLSYPIVNVLYPNSHSAGPGLLSIMGAASFFVCIMLMENAVLQASGKERLPMYSMITGSLVKIGVNWVLVARPEINIYGAPIGTLAGYFVMCVMNYVFLRTALPRRLRLTRILLRPLLASGIMGAAAWAVYALASRLIGAGSWIELALSMVLAMGVAVLVYLVAVICLRAITLEDMKMIPGGEKIGKILHLR